MRYFNPAGVHESGLISEDPKGKPENLMPYIAQVAVGRKNKVLILGDNYPTRDGTRERDYIDVVDLAYAHLKTVEKLFKLERFQILNLGTGRRTTASELIMSFQRVTGKKNLTKVVGRRPGDIARSWSDPSLAEWLLDIKLKRTIDHMCKDTWRWQSKNPNGYDNLYVV